MFSKSVLTASALVAAFTQRVSAIDKTVDPSLDSSIELAATQLDRYAQLPDNEAWKFDFTKSEFYTFAPGGVVNMNAATFPAAKGNGLTCMSECEPARHPCGSKTLTHLLVAMLNLGPCAMLPPHYHPRASNYVVAVDGKTTTYMFGENGAPLITQDLTPGHATIFPQGTPTDIARANIS